MGAGLHPNRPKTFARYLTIPQKVTTVSICAKGPGHPEGCSGPHGAKRSQAISTSVQQASKRAELGTQGQQLPLSIRFTSLP
jgi:hypothetical protein